MDKALVVLFFSFCLALSAGDVSGDGNGLFGFSWDDISQSSSSSGFSADDIKKAASHAGYSPDEVKSASASVSESASSPSGQDSENSWTQWAKDKITFSSPASAPAEFTVEATAPAAAAPTYSLVESSLESFFGAPSPSPN